MRRDKAILWIALPVLILALTAGYFCLRNMGTGAKVEPIAADAVESMTVTGMPEGEPVECGREQIASFVGAYNRARYYRDDYGTTHPLRVDMVFSDGTSLVVWGGTQGFQTIRRGGEQHNIRGWKLEVWFKGVHEE